MFRRFTKTRIVVGLSAVAALALAAGAFAYFTSTGSGSGTASVGTSTPFSITGTTTKTLYPGTSTPVDLSVTNSGGGNQQLGTISLSAIKACGPDVSSNPTFWSASLGFCTESGGSTNENSEVSACEGFTNTASSTTADFSMANVSEGQDLAPGTYNDSSNPAISDGTLTMNDLTSSQDSCKRVNLYLEFTS